MTEMKPVKRVVTLALIASLAGCAHLFGNSPADGPAQALREAEALLQAGRYNESRDAYARIVESHPATPEAERARFAAARILVHHGNPARDYARARREFGEFLRLHAKGELADEAASWLELLNAPDRSRVDDLVRRTEELAQKLAEAGQARRGAESARDGALQERDALVAERVELTRKIDSLLMERDATLKEKADLEKTVQTLSKEKQQLLTAKKKLEKSLLEITKIDVTMEKKRKKAR